MVEATISEALAEVGMAGTGEVMVVADTVDGKEDMATTDAYYLSNVGF